MRYSPLFHTEYDEREHVGYISMHYSILSAPQWLNEKSDPMNGGKAQIQNFAVIWDGDHDVRVIRVIEQAYMEGMLSPARYILERKGVVTVIVNDEFYNSDKIESYSEKLQAICDTAVPKDSFSARVKSLKAYADSLSAKLISPKMESYLTHIDNLWLLGLAPLSEHSHSRGVDDRPMRLSRN